MTNPLITELNCETGEAVDRPMTNSELQDFTDLQNERNATAQENEAAKETAIAKLAAIGLTADDLKALGL